MLIIIVFFIAHWYLSIFAQTFFLHRYAAHKMFTMNKGWERFWYLFMYFTQGSSFLVPRAYAVMHRMHHAFSDTDRDPHSPKFFREVFSMMWRTKGIYHGLVTGEFKAEEKFYKNYPVWKALDKFGESKFSRIGFMIFYLSVYLIFAPYWWLFLLLPVHVLMAPVHGAIVNWAGHKYGYRNWKEDDHSKNTLAIDFLVLGELFQNNHHHYGARANFANKWWEIDPAYPVIKLFDKIGVIKLNLLPLKA